jgi:hypothetical protein
VPGAVPYAAAMSRSTVLRALALPFAVATLTAGCVCLPGGGGPGPTTTTTTEATVPGCTNATTASLDVPFQICLPTTTSTVSVTFGGTSNTQAGITCSPDVTVTTANVADADCASWFSNPSGQRIIPPGSTITFGVPSDATSAPGAVTITITVDS